MSARLPLRRGLVASLLLVAGVTYPVPTAFAAVACDPSTTFCIDHAVSVLVPATSTTATTAAAPADLGFTVTNTSPDHRNDSARWLKTVSVQLAATLDDGPALAPSSQLPNGLLVAGSPGDCAPGADYSFSACTAGRGSALVHVSGTGYFDGVKDATFGIQRAVNVNPPTVPGAVTQLTVTYSYCVSTPMGPCNPQQTATATYSVGAAAPGAPAPVTFDVTTSFVFSAYGASATADASLDSLSFEVNGTSSTLGNGGPAGGTYPVVRLPRTCGPANATGSATSRGGAMATVPVTLTIDGCPTATALTSTQTVPLAASFSAGGTTPVPGRSIIAWRWSFGDGASARTTTATTQHTYPTSADRTVSVVAEDSAGALSAPRSIALQGVTLTAVLVPATTTYGYGATLTGRLTDSTTKAGLAGRTITLRRCDADGAACVSLGAVTTVGSSDAGTWKLRVTPTEAATYFAGYSGGGGYLGTITGAAAAVRPSISLAASRTTVPLGTTVTLSGKVSPSHAGQAVLIQRYLAGAWVTVATRTLSATSTYACAFNTAQRGASYYQVVKAADADHAAAVSHPMIVTVT